jgi:hypothetical protein
MKRKDEEEKGVVPDSQAGIRKRRGTMGNVYILDHLTKSELKKKGRRMCALFVDFRAAFDNVKVNGLFEATKGKGQVCPFSPLLFTIYVADIEEMLKKAQAGGSVVGREKFRAWHLQVTW